MAKLTKRQNQVLELILLGKTNAQIAKKLKIKEPTVKMHLTKLFKIKRVKTRLELVAKEYKDLRNIVRRLEGW